MKKRYFLLIFVVILLLLLAIFSQYLFNFTVVNMRLESPVNEKEMDGIIEYSASAVEMGPKYMFIEPKGNQNILIWVGGKWDKEKTAQSMLKMYSFNDSFNVSFLVDGLTIFNESEIINAESSGNMLSLVLDAGNFQKLKSIVQANKSKNLVVYNSRGEVYNTSLSSIIFSEKESKIFLPVFKENTKSKEFMQDKQFELIVKYGKLMRHVTVSKVWYQKRLVF